MNTNSVLIAVAAMLAAILSPIPSAHAQETTPHAEECTTWGFIQDIRYEFGVVNTCAYAIEVWFLSGTGASAHGEIAAGATFSSGLTFETADLNNWLSAVCRAGYHPNVSVSAENGAAIVNSQYACVRN